MKQLLLGAWTVVTISILIALGANHWLGRPLKPWLPAPVESRLASMDYLTAVARGALLVDCRTQRDYALGHIKGSICIPSEQARQGVRPGSKHGIYVFYCTGGCERAVRSARLAQEDGFSQAYLLADPDPLGNPDIPQRTGNDP